MKEESIYSSWSIEQLENGVIEKAHASLEAKKEQIEILLYIKTSGRWKENKRYARESFYVYIEDRFHIRTKTYYEMQKAFATYPKETVSHGVGLVSKVMRDCGKRAKDVLNRIDKEEISHKMPLKRKRIEEIIQESRTRKKIERIITDWKAMYETEKAAHELTSKALTQAKEEIKSLTEQIGKLKKTAIKVNEIRHILGQASA